MATTLMDVLPVFEKQLNPFEPFLTAWVGLCMLRDRAKESCSRWSGAVRLIHWSFDDPADVTESAEQRRQVFRRVRDEIASSIREFLASVPA
jgi:hypothetical protein